MLEDPREEAWKTYQYFFNKMLEAECKRGCEQGRAAERQEWLQTQREGLISVVQARFPDLVVGVTEKVNRIEDPLVLQDIMLKLASTLDNEEVRKYLLELK